MAQRNTHGTERKTAMIDIKSLAAKNGECTDENGNLIILVESAYLDNYYYSALGIYPDKTDDGGNYIAYRVIWEQNDLSYSDDAAYLGEDTFVDDWEHPNSISEINYGRIDKNDGLFFYSY